MLRILAAILFTCTISTALEAQQLIRNFNRDTVFKSMQCEIGLFAVKARRAGLGETLRAHIKYSTSGSVENKAGVEAGFSFASILQGPKLSAEYDFTRVDSSTLEGKLNLNQGNIATCVGRKPAIPLGIDDCLTEGISAIKGGFSTSCTRKVNAKATFNASGKFVAWVISIGPSYTGEIIINYQIDVDAPAQPDRT